MGEIAAENSDRSVENSLGACPPPQELGQLPLAGRRSDWLQQVTSAKERLDVSCGRPLNAPVYLEIHPYHAEQERPCNNACPHCIKGNDQRDLAVHQIEGIQREPLLRLIRRVGETDCRVKNVQISGNSTEPLMYPWIEAVVETIKGAGLPLRLYSNFYYGEKLLPLVGALSQDDNIRISLDAGDSRAYNRAHCPDDREAFPKILTNVKNLIAARTQFGRQFTVQVTYLLTPVNCSPKELRFVVNWAGSEGVDVVRFAVPLRPLGGADRFRDKILLTGDQLNSSLDLLEELRQGATTRVIVTREPSMQPRKPFQDCHHWKLVSVLGASGSFFPCCSLSQVALMHSMGRRNINDQDFDFMELWRDDGKWRAIDPQACAAGTPNECTRFEFEVNSAIDKLRQ